LIAPVDVTVVVPVHNAERHLEPLVTTVESTGLSTQVVLVDDASTDGSPQLLRQLEATHPWVSTIHLADNSGAGVARNLGFERSAGRYTLFFDADDVLHPDGLTLAVSQLDATGADLAILPYRFDRGVGSQQDEMNEVDQEVWARYLPDSGRRLARLKHVPRLLVTTNYPWNKVLRTRHYQDVGLRFGSTVVHNDILGHWYSLLYADQIVLVGEVICSHVVEPGAGNLTNRNSRARLALVDALDETYTLLEQHPDLRQRYAHYYWEFATRVMGWASHRIDPDLADEFRVLRREHLLRINLADFARMRLKRDPDLAEIIVRQSLF
jgi:glycosyltransferase involved in cell wall biosynthesis